MNSEGATLSTSLLLAAMPWAEPGLPSIQLGILGPVAVNAGARVVARSYYLAWLDCLINDGHRLADYEEVGSKHFGHGLGEWIFAVPPLREPAPERDVQYIKWLQDRGVPGRLIDIASRMRLLAPGFVDACADDIIAAAPDVVGFTLAFDQTLPSLAVARAVKLRRPALHVMFGGANCEGPMGQALHRTFPWVDTIVRGEAEKVLPDLLRDLATGKSPRGRPGVCYREGSHSVASPQTAVQRPPMDEIPTPDYDEYFARLRASPTLRRAVLQKARLPFETVRGCWWGEKMHCTFCGLNGGQMAFASKSPDRAFSDIETLAAKYQRLELEAVDNIMGLDHLRALLPRLAALRRRGYDLRLFYEVKSNLRREDVRLLREAGVMRIQPGIESLSTPILRQMRKGVTALINVRLLKWAEQYGIRAVWNIIYGFPQEPPGEYAKMAELLPALSHLKPPALVRLKLQRFSPYHDHPEKFGLSFVGPAAHYGHLFDVDEETLRDLAYDFAFDYSDGRDPEVYVAPLAEAVARWREAYQAGSALQYERGPGFLRILDERPGLPRRAYLFDDVEARIYLACDAGATPHGVWRSLDEHTRLVVTTAEIRGFLDDVVKTGLALEEDGKYLALAIPAHTDAEATTNPVGTVQFVSPAQTGRRHV